MVLNGHFYWQLSNLLWHYKVEAALCADYSQVVTSTVYKLKHCGSTSQYPISRKINSTRIRWLDLATGLQGHVNI